ncbi:MAG TPA: DinB family protein [Vicinamibacterales bacterium]|nr:DinB family protein [Vicinamibacterales bacterium]
MTFKHLAGACLLMTATAASAAAQTPPTPPTPPVPPTPPAPHAMHAPQMAQSATADREAAVTHLERTRAKFLKSIEGLTDAQWTFKSASDRWSIAEVAEHIALSESLILGMVQTKMMQVPGPKPEERIADDKMLAGLVDRTSKFQAPEVLKPVNKWATKDALARDFNTARDNTVQFVKTTTEDLRAHGGPHPVFKMLDVHQWILMISGHSERHTLQIEEVKTSAGYPK